MWRRKCIFLAALGSWICPSAPAQEAGNKELTARELFYTAVPSKTAAQPAQPKVTAIRPQPPPAQTARAQKKTPAPPATPPAMVVQAQTTTPAPPRAQSPATAPDGTRILTASTRRTAPAPSSGPALGLRYTISKLVDGKMVEVPADSTFRAGDRIRITVVPNTAGYLYIINQGSSGTWKPLFPSSDVEDGNNRVEAFRDYMMPPKSRMIFDEQVGTERLFVILSREPENDLEAMIYSLQAPKAQPASDPAPAKQAPKMLVAANIGNDMVGRMRQVYARDLVVEKVDENTPGERRETAVYVVNPSGSADSRVVADIALAHQ